MAAGRAGLSPGQLSTAVTLPMMPASVAGMPSTKDQNASGSLRPGDRPAIRASAMATAATTAMAEAAQKIRRDRGRPLFMVCLEWHGQRAVATSAGRLYAAALAGGDSSDRGQLRP
jgi:hypothetical protein